MSRSRASPSMHSAAKCWTSASDAPSRVRNPPTSSQVHVSASWGSPADASSKELPRRRCGVAGAGATRHAAPCQERQLGIVCLWGSSPASGLGAARLPQRATRTPSTRPARTCTRNAYVAPVVAYIASALLDASFFWGASFHRTALALLHEILLSRTALSKSERHLLLSQKLQLISDYINGKKFLRT